MAVYVGGFEGKISEKFLSRTVARCYKQIYSTGFSYRFHQIGQIKSLNSKHKLRMNNEGRYEIHTKSYNSGFGVSGGDISISFESLCGRLCSAHLSWEGNPGGGQDHGRRPAGKFEN
jgi:hypothetical protein